MVSLTSFSFVFVQLLFKYDLVKYDMMKDEPVKDKSGFCQRVKRGTIWTLHSFFFPLLQLDYRLDCCCSQVRRGCCCPRWAPPARSLAMLEANSWLRRSWWEMCSWRATPTLTLATWWLKTWMALSASETEWETPSGTDISTVFTDESFTPGDITQSVLHAVILTSLVQ